VDFQLNLTSETVDHAYPGEPLCIEPTATCRRVLELLKEQNRGAALVCENDKLVGIFTERDALKLMASGADFEMAISEVMSPAPVALSAEASVGKAIAKMSHGGYRRLPLVDEAGKPVGLLKVSSILHYLVEHFPSTIYNLPPDPHHTPQKREGA